jgi:hypothetical protein
MVRKSTIPILVTGGDDAYGTQKLMVKASTGIPDVYYDPHTLYIIEVTAANKPTVIEFYQCTFGSAVAYTGEADNDVITAAGHGLIDGDQFIFDTLNNETYGVDTHTVYYVRDMSGSTFKCALTGGGAAINITTDISGNIKKVTPTLVSETIVSCSATNSDSFPYYHPAPRILSSAGIYCRAKSVAGSTIGVYFFVGLHTYTE